MKSSIQLAPGKHLDNISKMFKRLYNDELLTDVTLCCKDGTIKAHKLILATSSPYFHKIFTENLIRSGDHPIIIMHGVSYQHLRDLIELIYKGNVEVLAESVNPLYELAGEFQLSGISGVLREENCCDKSLTHNHSTSSNDSIKTSEGGSHGRDTRFKGLKRVAVDFQDRELEEIKTTIVRNKELQTKEILHHFQTQQEQAVIRKIISEPTVEKVELSPEKIEPQMIPTNEEAPQEQEVPKLSAWAKKQRKFKCDLCPSSFKRSSHLTRHQLVHTGERPYACDQCDKAFSRHDKLKHHIRKTHETDYENDYIELPRPPSPLSPTTMPYATLSTNESSQEMNFGNIKKVLTTPEVYDGCPIPLKRPRGRPRKYPIDKFQLKRGRGRPRINPVGSDGIKGENFDITNLPYGDLDYLTMPLEQDEDSVMIEPYVEIKTESGELMESTKTKVDAEINQQLALKREELRIDKIDQTNGLEQTEIDKEKVKGEDEDLEIDVENLEVPKRKGGDLGAPLFQPSTGNLVEFETQIGTIGECTISVAN